jgi:hypothetical protein
MTDQERSQVLKMIEEGRVTPEEGLRLMQVLDQSPADDAGPAPDDAAPDSTPAGESGEASQNKTSGFEVDPRIENIKSTVRRFWQIPLWIGIAITVLSALGMYAVMRGPGMNFWFYFLLLPVLLGVVVITLAVGSHRARWLFVEVKQKPGERPERIFLGFPLPLKFTAWFLRTFGGMIPGLRNNNVNIDELSQLLETGFSGKEPLIVNVDEGEGSERVKVFIG